MDAEAKREYNKQYRIKNAKRIAAQRKAYREANKEKIAGQKREYSQKNPDKVKQAQRRKYQANKEKYAKTMKAYYEANKETIKANRKKYYKENKPAILEAQKKAKKRPESIAAHREARAKYVRLRRQRDPMFTIIGRMRCRINDALRNRRFPKTGKTEELIGCDYPTLMRHLESKFQDGMGWHNRSQWHIDHIIPLASAKDEAELASLFHYTNLQPLWARDNLSKSDKLPDDA